MIVINSKKVLVIVLERWLSRWVIKFIVMLGLICFMMLFIENLILKCIVNFCRLCIFFSIILWYCGNEWVNLFNEEFKWLNSNVISKIIIVISKMIVSVWGIFIFLSNFINGFKIMVRNIVSKKGIIIGDVVLILVIIMINIVSIVIKCNFWLFIIGFVIINFCIGIVMV